MQNDQATRQQGTKAPSAAVQSPSVPQSLSASVPSGTRVYLAGPMTGLPGKNYPAFHAAAARLRARGFTVISPAEINSPDATWEDSMRICIPALLTCDIVALIRGWEDSKGTRLEVINAAAFKMPLHDEATWAPISGRRAIIRELLKFPSVPQCLVASVP